MSCTGSDIKALRRGGVLVRASADAFLQRIVYHAGLDFPNTSDMMTQLALRVRERDEAVLKSDCNMPYDGGADGGVVPDAFVRKRRLPAVPWQAPQTQNTALRLYQTHDADSNRGWHLWSLTLQAMDGSNPIGVEKVG